MFMRQWRRPMTISSNSALLLSFWQLRDVLLQIFKTVYGEMCSSQMAEHPSAAKKLDTERCLMRRSLDVPLSLKHGYPITCYATLHYEYK
ncbi:hypothetical protein PoB_000963900 [Plakobranchus ocellatus]|uniref:Secreted protein n=1 Tax=Plakobranchus ocellatus TaxID=259542 RepID=A0AAV3YLX9_9GAST|nr:hypothetical protein PoB_000963900 [Plakobranchus ocellatus]